MSSVPKANHILVVDDAETNLLFAEYILGKVNPGGSVTCVESAQSAIDLLKQKPDRFSMVLIDIEMPDMDGIQGVQEIRKFNVALSIVALTAHGDDAEMLQKCLAAGMDGVASKPFREASIAMVVSTYNGKLSKNATKNKVAKAGKEAKTSAWVRGFFVSGDKHDKQTAVVESYLRSLGDSRLKPKEKQKSAFLKALALSSDPALFSPIADGIKDVSSGCNFNVVVLNDGKVLVQCHPKAPKCIFPNGRNADSTALAAPVTHVAAGDSHVIAWSASTKNICSWGLNVERQGASRISGQLGRAQKRTHSGPGVVAIEGNVLEASCGAAHTLVLTDVGLFGFGLNTSGQVAQNTLDVVLVPSSIFVGNTVVSKVACGSHHSLLITNTGAVLSWGLNEDGQCGQAAGAAVTRPAPVAGLAEVVQVCAGVAHSMALTRRGTVCTWGANACHQLGRRAAAGSSHEAGAVQGHLSKLHVQLVSCGHHFCVAVDSQGVAWTWGSLQAAGATKHAKMPERVQVGSLHKLLRFVKISSGAHHTAALLTDTWEEPDLSESSEQLLQQDDGFNEKTASMTLSAKVLNAFVRKKGSSSNPDMTAPFGRTSGELSSSRKNSAERKPGVLERGSLTASLPELPSSNVHDSDEGSEADQTLITSSSVRLHGKNVVSVVYKCAEAPAVHDAYSVYAREFLGKNHFLLMGQSHAGSKVVAVLRLPCRGNYSALVFTKYGIFSTQIDQTLVLGTNYGDLGSPRDLDIKLLTFFINYGYHDFDQNLAGFPLEISLKSREDASEISWRIVSATKTQMSNHLLSLETRLGFSQRLTVGLVCNIDGESAEDVFTNPKNSGGDTDFKRFCKILGAPVNKADWPHFNGGLADHDEVKSIFYTCWRGFEIVFHLAPSMTADLRRQFIGNNKTLVVFTKNAVPAGFRGSVNSLAIVVQSLSKDEATAYSKTACKAGWRCGVYFRSKMWNFKPCGLSSSVIVSKSKLRNIVLANAVNGCSSATATLAGFRKIFEQEVESLVDHFWEETPVG